MNLNYQAQNIFKYKNFYFGNKDWEKIMLYGRFSEFMKRKMNHIDSDQQNTSDIDGYYYEGADGSQICFWTYFSDRESKENVYEFDEYVVCVSGEYVGISMGNKIPILQFLRQYIRMSMEEKRRWLKN